MIKKISFSFAFFCLAYLSVSSQVWADPVIIPPNNPNIPPTLTCWKATGANALSTGGIELQFEVLNWTDKDAQDLELTLNPAASTGGAFGTSPAPLAGPFPGKVNQNDWSIAQNTTSFIRWVAGTPLANFDVQAPNGIYITQAQVPSPIDGTFNTLDGFRLTLPNLDPGERIVFDWALSDFSGLISVADGNGPIVNNQKQPGFEGGIVQIDRADNAPNGQVRLSWFFNIGGSSKTILDFPPVDLPLTNQNAVTVPTIVPLPSAVILFGSSLLGFMASSIRRSKR